ncbi:MAG: VOC family protein [Candidatus Dormiibacterota bacterium]
MKILGINWVGVKTADFDLTRSFFAEVMGLRVTFERPDFAVMRLPNGAKVEIFGPAGPDPDSQFAENAVVAGFLVDDIEAARAELLAGGVELLGEIEGRPGGDRWQHFRSPDGKVFELCSDAQIPG